MIKVRLLLALLLFSIHSQGLLAASDSDSEWESGSSYARCCRRRSSGLTRSIKEGIAAATKRIVDALPERIRPYGETTRAHLAEHSYEYATLVAAATSYGALTYMLLHTQDPCSRALETVQALQEYLIENGIDLAQLTVFTQTDNGLEECERSPDR